MQKNLIQSIQIIAALARSQGGSYLLEGVQWLRDPSARVRAPTKSSISQTR